MAKIEKVETKEAAAAVGAYSQGTMVDRFVFVSGQLLIDPETGQLVKSDIKLQTEHIIGNVEAILRAAGLGLKNVMRCDVFLKDMKDFKATNEVYSSKVSTEPKLEK